MVLVIVRHRDNIMRLLKGTEPQVHIGRARRSTMRRADEKNRHPRRGKLGHGAGHRARTQPAAAPVSLWVHSADVLAALSEPPRKRNLSAGHARARRSRVTARLGEALAGRGHRARRDAFGARPRRLHADAAAPRCTSVASRTIFVSATKGLEHDSLAAHERGHRRSIGAAAWLPRLASPCSPVRASPWKSRAATPPPWSSPPATTKSPRKFRKNSPARRCASTPTTTSWAWNSAAPVKNVIAIAAGVCAGLGLGANTIAALVTRGLAEMTRLAVAPGRPPRHARRTCRTGRPGADGHRIAQPQPLGRRGARQGPPARRDSGGTCAWSPKAWAPPPRRWLWRASTESKCPSPSRCTRY